MVLTGLLSKCRLRISFPNRQFINVSLKDTLHVFPMAQSSRTIVVAQNDKRLANKTQSRVSSVGVIRHTKSARFIRMNEQKSLFLLFNSI